MQENESINNNPVTEQNKKKPTVWKTIIAFALIFAIGYGVGFSTIYLMEKAKGDESIINQDPTEDTCPDDEIVEGDTHDRVEVKKPIIYLYPETSINVSVKLGYDNMLTTSYPLYNNGWDVKANPDGTLIHNGRELYSLYYESNLKTTPRITNEGFVVAKENLISFLEEKLAVLGLNSKETEEFIIYWLPVLEQNEYNYIRFATQEEINKQMPLEITPAPDTTIRVWMYYKGLDSHLTVKEQVLTQQTRKGFTAVEWGGAEVSTIRLRPIHPPRIKLPPINIHKIIRGANG